MTKREVLELALGLRAEDLTTVAAVVPPEWPLLRRKLERAADAFTQAFASAGCLGNNRGDEPVFVLVARDRLAPLTVELWADNAEGHGVSVAKCEGARKDAAAMLAWQAANGGKDPD